MFNDISFSKIFNFERIFDLSPGSEFYFEKSFLTLFGIIFLLGLIFSLIASKEKNILNKKIYRKFSKTMYWISLTGFLYIFLRKENVYLFSARVLLALIIFIFICRLVYLSLYLFKKHPQKIKKHEQKKELEKYIPKPKRKKK